jgi:hypothetical protein
MQNFLSSLKQIVSAMMLSIQLVTRGVWDSGVWITRFVAEVVMVPMHAVGGLLSAFGRPGASNTASKTEQAATDTERQVRTANTQTSREQERHDTARLVQRTARFRELGHTTAANLAAELPPVLRDWVMRISTAECARLAATDTRAVVGYLRLNNIHAAPLPGIPPIALTPADVTAHRQTAAGGRTAEHTEAEQAVLNILAERIKARKAAQHPEDDDNFRFAAAH